MKNKKLLSLTQAGMIAALYTVLTLFAGAFGLANGAVQVRISEALCVLPVFFPAAVPGLAVGCLLSNLFLGCWWQDILFGTLATLLGALGARLLGRISVWLAPLPTVLFNTLILPPVFAFVYGAEEGLGFLFLSVGAGELLSAYVLGMFLLLSLRRFGGKWMRP